MPVGVQVLVHARVIFVASTVTLAFHKTHEACDDIYTTLEVEFQIHCVDPTVTEER